MEISAIRYGEPLSRSDLFVFSWRAVALMTSSARVPGSIFSITVAHAPLCGPGASRALRPCLTGA